MDSFTASCLLQVVCAGQNANYIVDLYKQFTKNEVAPNPIDIEKTPSIS